MNESKCKRQDPYTGAQLIYDYLYCRKGIYPENKYRNLILHFPKISLSAWEEKNPNDPNSKKDHDDAVKCVRRQSDKEKLLLIWSL